MPCARLDSMERFPGDREAFFYVASLLCNVVLYRRSRGAKALQAVLFRIRVAAVPERTAFQTVTAAKENHREAGGFNCRREIFLAAFPAPFPGFPGKGRCEAQRLVRSSDPAAFPAPSDFPGKGRCEAQRLVRSSDSVKSSFLGELGMLFCCASVNLPSSPAEISS